MRFAIVGNSGSGKSTLARRLAARHAITSLDLDTIYWEPGAIAVARAATAREADLRCYCAANAGWVVEGCYGDLISVALEWMPELIFLDPGREACLRNCHARPHESHKYKSAAEQDERLDFLLRWVEAYYERDGPMSHCGHLALFESYRGPKQRITGQPA